MANYTTVSVSNYNTSPPSDDGATTEANRGKWATIKTKLSDPVKTAVESINTSLLSLLNDNSMGYADDTGSANTYAISVSASVTAYADGQTFKVVIANANTGASTLNVNTLGAKAIQTVHAGTLGALVGGELKAGHIAFLVYDSSVDAFILVNPDPAIGLDQDYVNLASAATTNIGGAASHKVNITGTTTITAFDTVAAGISRDLKFAGALTLTYNATSLILPGNANITTTAGDTATFVSEGSGNWRCTAYQKEDGKPVVSQSVAIICDQKAQNTAGGTFTNGADRTRDLNTEISDPDGIVSISSNQFTLANPGTYRIDWTAPAYEVDLNQSFLYDITGAAELTRGSSDRAGATNFLSHSTGSFIHTITASNTYEIRHRCATTVAGDGFGIASNFGVERYTFVIITKLS